MDRRTFILGLGSIAAGFPSSSHAQSLPSRVTWVVWKEIPTIIILSAEDDFRVLAIREAVDFWKAEVAQLGSPFRFGAIVRSLQIDLGRRFRCVENKDPFAFAREQHEGSERRRDRRSFRRCRFQSIRIPLAGTPKSLGRNPKLSKISVLAQHRTQCCRPRAGSCAWIGPQRRCNLADVRRNCPVPLQISQ